MPQKTSGGPEIRAVVLAAGRGQRLRPLTSRLPKALVQVGSKALVDILIETYQAAGVTSFTFGVGWQGDLLRKHLEETHIGLEIDIIDVPNYHAGPLTTLTTILKTIEDEPLLVGPVDHIMQKGLLSGVVNCYHKKESPEDLLLFIDSSVEEGTTVFLKEDGLIAGISSPMREHDFKARSAMLMILSQNGSKMLIDSAKEGVRRVSEALNQFIDRGVRVGYMPVDMTWFDIDTIDDILRANRYVLRHMRETIDAPIIVPPGDSMEFGESLRLSANVFVERGVSLRGPVLIQKNCKIDENTVIGPDVVLGYGTEIGADCSLTNVTLFTEARIKRNMNLENAVVFDSEILKSEE